MLKRILAITAMVCALPALATAGTAKLETWVKTPGGYITTNKTGTFQQTSAYGQRFTNYSTPTDGVSDPKVTVVTNPGYTATVTASTNCVAAGNVYTCTDITAPSSGSSVVAYFTYAPVLAQMTAVAGEGGKVNMTSIPNVYIGQKLLSSVKFVFTPKAGYTIATSGVTFNGSATVPANVVVTGGGAFPVTVTFLSGYAVNGNMALGSTFTPIGAGAPANAGAPVNVATGVTTATLTGTPAGGTWSKIGGPSVYDETLKKYVPVPATIDASGNVAGLAVNGTYYFKYAVNGTYATTQVIVGQSAAASCQGCHDQNGVGAGIEAAFAASAHGTTTHATVECASCHVGASTGGHPGITPTGATCAGCHAGPYVAHEGKYTDCIGCHNGHSLATTHPTANCVTCHEATTFTDAHYGGNAFTKAQYVSDASLPVSCSNCHGYGNQVSTTTHQAILAQYTSSGHGSPLAEAWRHYDWRSTSRASCQRCHAGTAFVAKLGIENSTTSAYQAADVFKPGEVLNCSACHTSVDTGALRSAPQSFAINMTNGATVTYDVAGASTLCARCHGGRETGDSIKADPNTTGVRGFINSHYLAAAGTLYNKAGYEYAGQVYDSLGSHKLLGAAGQGPCVTCHMAGKNHTFKAASCGSCHTVVPDVKADYDAALNNLKLALEAKGIYYAPVHPYFYTAAYVAGGPNTAVTDWGAAYGASSWKDTMGAAFNYNLLVNEPGAFAHNYAYAMKLIADSIDFMSDGVVAP